MFIISLFPFAKQSTFDFEVMTAEQLINMSFEKISALSGIIFTAVIMVLIRIVFIGAEGSVLVKMSKNIACLMTGILSGYLVHDVANSIVIVCGTTAAGTLFADKLVRKIYDQGPDIVWEALKEVFTSFVEKLKARSPKEK